jgi:hypothetical protein
MSSHALTRPTIQCYYTEQKFCFTGLEERMPRASLTRPAPSEPSPTTRDRATS